MESKMKELPWGREWRNSKEEYHRENDLPAFEKNDGYSAWYINGNRHRELGPARICVNGREEWYLNNIEYTPKNMPIKLFMAYCNWEYKKKNE